MGTDRIPVYASAIGDDELKNLGKCLAEGAFVHGSFRDRFEEAVAQWVGCRYAAGTNSGTAALHLAQRASNIRPGDEVFVITLSFIAPANAITYLRAADFYRSLCNDVPDGYNSPAAVHRRALLMGRQTAHKCCH